MSTPQNVERLASAMQRIDRAVGDRARDLNKSFNQVARDAGITTETLSALRGKGKRLSADYRPYDKTARGIDRALGWPDGTTMAIWDGREPASVASDDDDPAVAKIRAMPNLSNEQREMYIANLRAIRRDTLARAKAQSEQQHSNSSRSA